MFDFDGDPRPTRKINLGARSARAETREELLKRTKLEREQRETQRLRNKSAQLIQAVYRKSKVIGLQKREERNFWDKLVEKEVSNGIPPTAQKLQQLTRSLLFFFNPILDQRRLSALCDLLITSHTLEEKYSYTSLARCKETNLAWVIQLRKLVAICIAQLPFSSPENTRKYLTFSLLFTNIRNLSVSDQTARLLGSMIATHLIDHSSVERIRSFMLNKMGNTTDEEKWMLKQTITLLSNIISLATNLSNVYLNRLSTNLIEILAIPMLSNRIPLSILLEFVAPIDFVFLNLAPSKMSSFSIESIGCLLFNLLDILYVYVFQSKPLSLEKARYLIQQIRVCYSSIPMGILFKSDVSHSEDMEYDTDEDEVEKRPKRIDFGYRCELEEKIKKVLLDQKVIGDLFNYFLSNKQTTIPDSLYNLCFIYRRLYEDAERSMRTKIVSTLVYTDIIPSFWRLIESSPEYTSLLQYARPANYPFISNVMYIWSVCYSQLLLIQNDEEFFEKQQIFSLQKIRTIALTLKELLCKMLMVHEQSQEIDNDKITEHLQSSLVALLNQLHDRNARQSFIKSEEWLLQTFTFEKIEEKLVSTIPFVVPFYKRVQYFRQKLSESESNPSRRGFYYGKKIKVRREHLLVDAYNGFSALTPDELKSSLKIKFVGFDGLAEAGIDGGGLFKEFITEVAKAGFIPEVGLFKQTPSKQLYPNPTSYFVIGEDHLRYFEFLGRVIAKAVYEGVLVDVPFAHFFLSKLLGKKNTVHDLRSLDPQLYRNLMQLMHYTGSVEDDFSLTFSVVENEYDEQRVIDLEPGGRDIPVTNDNVVRYIYLMAYYKMSAQIKKQTAAFIAGFTSLIDHQLISVFNGEELQLLISGDQGELNLDDFRANTKYGGGYTAEHPTVLLFWEVMASFTKEQQSSLLKFATSCPRPPLLGFKHLTPSFCIYRIQNIENLPTASTCMNLLKLPDYPEKHLLRDRLLYAIESGAGFELS